MKLMKQRAILFAFAVVVALGMVAQASAKPKEKNHPPVFLPEERRVIIDFFPAPPSGLPPGLAKRGGNLPPGLQKQIRRKGALPPGLQKRIQPLPRELEIRLPAIPSTWERVILERDVILVDRRTNRILDIIENVIGLIQNR